MTFREKVGTFFEVLGELLWRGFGLFLFIVPTSAGVGAVATGDWFIGIVLAWGTLMVGVLSAVGYSIAITGRATKSTVSRGIQDAVQRYEEKNDNS